jgi:hypothetical protein
MIIATLDTVRGLALRVKVEPWLEHGIQFEIDRVNSGTRPLNREIEVAYPRETAVAAYGTRWEIELNAVSVLALGNNMENRCCACVPIRLGPDMWVIKDSSLLSELKSSPRRDTVEVGPKVKARCRRIPGA